MSTGGFENTGCVKSELKRMRVEVTGLSAVEDGAIELPCGGKRAARVAVSGSPVRP
jgi:hypothetical protein